MKKILKLFTREELWVVFLILFSVGITVSLFFNEVSMGKNILPDRFQTFEHNFLPDFNAYLSKMTQGGKGEWLVYERMTNEPHEPSFLQIFYLLIGKIGVGGIRVDIVYHFWRFFWAVVRLLAAYYFILAVWPEKNKKILRILAFILFIFAGNFPFKIINPIEYGVQIGEDKYRLIFEVWTNLDPLIRLSYLPHWMAGQTVLMICLGLLIKGRYGIVGILGMIGGFILPSVPLIIIPVWFLVTIIYRKNILGFLVGAILMAAPLIYIKWVTGFAPWSALAQSDRSVFMIFPWEGYFKALGVLMIGVIGIIGVVINGGRGNRAPTGIIITALWAFVAFGMMWVFDRFLHYDQRRFIQVGVELPLAVLTVYLIEKTIGKIGKIWGIGVIGVILIPSIFVWYISYVSRVDFVRDRMGATRPVSATPYVVYPLKDWMEGVFWLSENTTVNDVVFSDYVAGNYIAAYAGNRVYAGHGGQTVDYLNKLGRVKDFYSGKMKEKEALLFLNGVYAKYVFVGPQEVEYGGTLKYSFLEPVYTGATTKIYKIGR